MNLTFVKDLNESSQYRTRFSFSSVTPRILADHSFIDCVVLWILYNEYDYAPVATEYARKTTIFGNFNIYRQSSTDLYMTLYALTSKDSTLIKIDDRAKLFLDKVTINSSQIQSFLKKIANNSLTSLFARQFLQQLERDLKIETSNYRSIRRLAQDWGMLSTYQKSLVVTRIVQFYEAHAPKSELFDVISTFANNKNLLLTDADNAEDIGINSVSRLATLGTNHPTRT